ncbi:MAG: ROK family protein [Fimbriimonadia bacterium]
MQDTYVVDDFCVIGVDLGGTNVRALAVEPSGNPVGEFASQPSRAKEGAAAVADACADVVRSAERSAGRPCKAVGMAVPGHIDPKDGSVRWAPNFGEYVGGIFRHFADVPLTAMVRERLGVPVHSGNDANLAALGEFMFGKREERPNGLVMITLGTGIGSGIVLTPDQMSGGEPPSAPLLLVGSNGGGAELGHTVVFADGPQCGCGAYGCAEALVNANAIVQRGRAKLEHDPTGLLAQLSGGDPSRITPKLLADAAAQGDESALEVWRETGHYLGVLIGNVINTFVPELVVLGGQISQAGPPLWEPTIRSARNTAIPTLFAATRIEPATEPERAGALGGAALALQRLSR